MTTVNNKFDIKSGKTGEQLAENSAVGVTDNQSASRCGCRQKKFNVNWGNRSSRSGGLFCPTRLERGTNQIMGFPRAGELGYVNPTGLASKPAVATGS